MRRGVRPSRRPFRRDESGATITEFALVIPVVLTIIIGMIETGLLLTAQGVLDGAVSSAARFGSINATGSLPDDVIRARVADQTVAFIDVDQIQVSARSYPNFAAIGESTGTPGYGGPNDVVVYTVTYPWQGFTPFIGAAFDSITLRATVTVRNEPPQNPA